MSTVKLSKQGNSTGVTIPAEMLETLNLKRGDEVSLSLIEGGIKIAPADSAYQKAMDAGRKVAVRYRRALRDLAK
jgi:putative addiction module antidote